MINYVFSYTWLLVVVSSGMTRRKVHFTQPQRLFDAQTQQFIDTPSSSSGMTRQVGRSNGKPVYEDAKGNRFIAN